jgi:hypothetical protein
MDPEIWIIKLQELQAKLAEMGERLTDGTIIAHILAHLPKDYDNVADQLARDKFKTVASVCDELKQKFERMKAGGDIEDDNQKALPVVGYKKYDGYCTCCGKKGHKTSDCYHKRNDKKNKGKGQRNNKKKFQGRCFHCGIYCHRYWTYQN